MMSDLTLHLPKLDAAVNVEVCTRTGRLLVHNADYSIDFAMSGADDDRSLSAQLRAWAALIDEQVSNHRFPPGLPPAGGRVVGERSRGLMDDWQWLTPQMVIDYFEQSEVLKAHAADVRTVLAPMIDGDAQADAQLARDVAACEPYRTELIEAGELVYGGQSQIARILGITNGGSHRQRILAVAAALRPGSESSTVTSTSTSTAGRSWVEPDSRQMAA